jgi:hypothetical protein
MKTLLLLGAASSLVLALTPTASFAQTEASISSATLALTCRSALQGGEFSQVQDIASPPCCYVSIEEDWYKSNGIRIASIYQRSNGDTYRAESCDLISDAGLPVDDTTTGGIGGIDAPQAGQPAAMGGVMPGGNNVAPPAQGPGAVSGNTGGAGNGGNTGAKTGGSGGANSGGQHNGNGGQNGGSDGNNGHGNDAGGVDPSNPGNSSGTGNKGNTGGGNQDRGKGNNGFGNGGEDGSPNGMQDKTR